jgi:hypothetical protein
MRAACWKTTFDAYLDPEETFTPAIAPPRNGRSLRLVLRRGKKGAFALRCDGADIAARRARIRTAPRRQAADA